MPGGLFPRPPPDGLPVVDGQLPPSPPLCIIMAALLSVCVMDPRSHRCHMAYLQCNHRHPLCFPLYCCVPRVRNGLYQGCTAHSISDTSKISCLLISGKSRIVIDCDTKKFSIPLLGLCLKIKVQLLLHLVHADGTLDYETPKA